VLEPGDRASLFDDPRARGRIRGRMDELHGDRPVEQRVVREVDLAIAPKPSKRTSRYSSNSSGGLHLGLTRVMTRSA